MLGPTIMACPGGRKITRAGESGSNLSRSLVGYFDGRPVGRRPSRTTRRRRAEDELRGDGDRLVQRSVHRTGLGEGPVHPLRRLPLFRGRRQTQSHVNPPDDEHVVFGQLDFTDRLGGQPVAVGSDVARLQRASEGPCQSAGCGRDDVVERGRVRLERSGRDPVVLGDRAVDAEDDRLRLAGEVGAPEGTSHPLDPNLGTIDDLRHNAGDSGSRSGRRMSRPLRGLGR